jgi:hypothetical protein
MQKPQLVIKELTSKAISKFSCYYIICSRITFRYRFISGVHYIVLVF